MSKQTTTQAQTISARYGDDGARWNDADGVYLEDALLAAGARASYSPKHSALRWTLPDGSVITTSGGGWDYGYPDCYCWTGTGHTDECQVNQGTPETVHVTRVTLRGVVYGHARRLCDPAGCAGSERFFGAIEGAEAGHVYEIRDRRIVAEIV